MKLEHPTIDYFGTTIDRLNDSYWVSPEGYIIHPLNENRYMGEILKAQLVHTNDEL